jgi:hypothetical protein
MVLPDPTSDWRLSVRHHLGRTELAGEEGRRWLGYLLARVNRGGGSDGLVAESVKQIETTPADSFIAKVAEESARLWEVDSEKIRARREEQFRRSRHGLARRQIHGRL